MRFVTVHIDNCNAYLDVSGLLHQELDRFWSYYHKGYRFSPQYKLRLRARQMALADGLTVEEDKLPGWDGRIRFFKRNTVPAGLFRATRVDAEKELGIHFRVSYDLPAPDLKFVKPITDAKYSYQDDCIKAMCASIKRGGGIVLAATRSGKTATAARFFKSIPYSCLFVVDQRDLLHQNAQEIEHWLGEKVGIVGDSTYRAERVTVATIQTVQKHINDLSFKSWYRQIQIVVIDELHEQLNRRNFAVTNMIQPMARYGITATLQLGRKDVRFRAFAFGGPVIYKFPVSEGISRGVLTNGRCIQLLFNEQNSDSSNYQIQYRNQVTENNEKAAALNGLVTSLIMSGRYVLILTERVQHLKDLSRRLSGIDHRVAFGEVKQTDRADSRADFEQGNVKLLIANKVFKKGITMKRLDAIIDTAEMKSKNDAIQKFGRGLGLHDDKTELLYIDFGTSGGGWFHKAARSRLRAIRSLGVEAKTVKVHGTAEAIKAVFKFLNKSTPPKIQPKQLALL